LDHSSVVVFGTINILGMSGLHHSKLFQDALDTC